MAEQVFGPDRLAGLADEVELILEESAQALFTAHGAQEEDIFAEGVAIMRLRARWLRGMAWFLEEADTEERMVAEAGYGIYQGNPPKSVLHVVQNNWPSKTIILHNDRTNFTSFL